MSLIGIYHYRKDPKNYGRAYRYAAIAKLENVDIFYFTSKGVDFDNKTINGFYYDNGKWLEKEFPFPDVIINHVGPITKKQRAIYNKLMKLVPFTSNPVGTKLTVYNKIKKGKEFVDYLIPYQKLKKPIDVLEFLEKHPQIILKPLSGHHGKGIIFIEKIDENFIIKTNDENLILNRIKLYEYITKVQEKNKMIIQKYINSKTNTDEPFDIRIHLQKDENGKWINTKIYPKVGFSNKVITNLSSGGKITLLKTFLESLYGKEYFDMKKYLEVFAIQFANHFESLYKHKFDELGIDVGLDENNRIWIYEVNWRPGHIFIEFNAAVNVIKYAKYLASLKRKEDEK